MVSVDRVVSVALHSSELVYIHDVHHIHSFNRANIFTWIYWPFLVFITFVKLHAFEVLIFFGINLRKLWVALLIIKSLLIDIHAFQQFLIFYNFFLRIQSCKWFPYILISFLLQLNFERSNVLSVWVHINVFEKVLFKLFVFFILSFTLKWEIIQFNLTSNLRIYFLIFIF